MTGSGRLHIAILASTLPPHGGGGAERQALQLAHELAARGHRVQLFVRGATGASQRSGKILIHHIALPHCSRALGGDRSPLVFALDLVGWLIRLWRSGRPDVIISYQTLKPGLIGSLHAALSRVPHVLSVRSEADYRQVTSLPRQLFTLFAWLGASLIVAQTPTIVREMRAALEFFPLRRLARHLSRRLVVVPNGVELPERADAPSGRQLLFVGRLVRRKAVDLLIDAVGDIHDARLVLVGDGDDRRRLEVLAMGRDVQFLGSQGTEEVSRQYRAAALVVLPSTFGEGLPNVILEAMAAGRPVVATATAGIEDIVVDGETGRLVEPGSVEALRGAIGELLDAPGELQRMGANARLAAERYAWPFTAEQFECLLYQLTATSRPRR